MDPEANDLAEPLSALRRAERGLIVALDDSGESFGDDQHATIARRLLELGFIPGAEVELIATMWPGDDPLAVRVGGATFALRRHEAHVVRIRRLSGS